MKYLSLILILLVPVACNAQKNGSIIDRQKIDLREAPFYGTATEVLGGDTVWKEPLRYLDSIDIYEITYLSDGLKINGFLVEPQKEGIYPCIIMNRGGNRDFGALNIASAAYWLGDIAKHGYVVIASQYRGNGGSEGQEEFGGADVNDIVVLPEVLNQVDRADTSLIGMYGWSRGGMMTYIALTRMSGIKAAVVGAGITDLNGMIVERPGMESEVVAQLIPGYKEHMEEELTKRSALKWVDKFPQNIPLLIMHGTADWRVNPDNSLRLALELEKYSIPYRLIMFEGSDHGITEHKNEVSEQTVSWFDRFLKNNEPLPQMKDHGR